MAAWFYDLDERFKKLDEKDPLANLSLLIDGELLGHTEKNPKERQKK